MASNTTRRAVLKAAPVVAAAAALPALAGEGETEIARLFRDLIAAKSACSVPGFDMDDPAYDDAFRRMMEVERKIMSASPMSVRDLAFQIVTADDDGDMNMNTAQVALSEAARRIVGIPCGASISTLNILPAPDPETDIARLWRRRNEAFAAYRAGQEGATDPDAHTSAFCAEEEAIFVEIAAIEPTSVRDYAIKMAAWFGMDERAADNGKLVAASETMYVEIAKLAGITPKAPTDHWLGRRNA